MERGLSSNPVNLAVLKKIGLSYGYVGIWVSLSFTVIMFNKYILDRNLYGWSFPVSLTMIHMAVSSAVSFFLVRVAGVVGPAPVMSPRTYASSVVPIGALYSLSLWLSNSAYVYLSVSFIQMLKALMPAAVYSVGVALRMEPLNQATMINMLGVSAGVAVATYGEARLDPLGVAMQLAAVVFESTRLVLIQLLLTSKGIHLNPITSLYYIAPCCLAFLSLPWILLELPSLSTTFATFTFATPDYVVFAANSACAFALNLAVFLLIGKTSALTMNVAGVVKDWLLIAFSWSVIKDRITPLNLIGYGLAFIGVCYYNHKKLQDLKAKEAQKKPDEEEGESLLEQKSNRDNKSETPVAKNGGNRQPT